MSLRSRMNRWRDTDIGGVIDRCLDSQLFTFGVPLLTYGFIIYCVISFVTQLKKLPDVFADVVVKKMQEKNLVVTPADTFVKEPVLAPLSTPGERTGPQAAAGAICDIANWVVDNAEELPQDVNYSIRQWEDGVRNCNEELRLYFREIIPKAAHEYFGAISLDDLVLDATRTVMFEELRPKPTYHYYRNAEDKMWYDMVSSLNAKQKQELDDFLYKHYSEEPSETK